MRCTTPRVLSLREAACPPYLSSGLGSGLRDSEASSVRGGHRKHRRVDLADLVGQNCGATWTALDGSNVRERGK